MTGYFVLDDHSSGSPKDGKERGKTLPVTFAKQEYIQVMVNDLGLDKLKEENFQEYVHKMAVVRAEYDTLMDSSLNISRHVW